MSAGVTVRRLGPADGAAWRDLRLEALRLHPAAFGSDHDEEAARPPSAAIERLTRNVVWGAFDAAGALIGSAGLTREDGAKERHKAFLWGVYVRAAARGTGLAARLVAAACAQADADGIEQIHLTVSLPNEPARRLYGRFGFTTYGIEPRALKVAGTYHDEELRVRSRP